MISVQSRKILPLLKLSLMAILKAKDTYLNVLALQLMPMGEVLYNNSQQRQHIKFLDWTSIYMQT